ncbi:MAG: nitroreductase family protein [Thermomicrobiales bacterium]
MTDQLTEILRRSRNTRFFTADPVPDAALNGILEIARWTGSARNLQPWQFVIVDDRETLAAIAASSPSLSWLAGAPLAIVLVMDGVTPEIEAFDEGRLAERIFAAARAYGLEAGIGWFLPGAPRDTARRILDVPEGQEVRTVIAIGHPDPAPPPSPYPIAQPRKPLSDLVHRNRFGNRAS